MVVTIQHAQILFRETTGDSIAEQELSILPLLQQWNMHVDEAHVREQ